VRQGTIRPSDLGDSVKAEHRAILADPARVRALESLDLLDTEPEEAFDRLARVVALALDVPIALVNLITADRQFFKSSVGVEVPRELPVETGVCRYALVARETLVIEDAPTDPGFAENGFVTDHGLTAYIGVPLISREGHAIGTFCVVDTRPRNWSAREVAVVTDLANAVMTELELRLTRRELEAEQIRLVRVFEQAPAFLATVRGPDHVFEMANPQYHQLVGHRDILGRPVAEALPEVADQGVVDILDQVYRTGEAFSAASVPMALHRLPEAPVEERVLTFVFQPIRATDGAVSGIIALGVDVTDQTRAQQRAERAEAHYRRLVENSPQAIFAVDTEGRFTDLNPAGERVLGKARSEVLGAHFASVIYPDDLPVATKAFRAVLEGDSETLEFDVRIMRPDVVPRRLTLSTAGVRGETGIVGVQGIARDITDEAVRGEQLRRAERLASVGTMVGGVAHELNNPLQAIRSFAELLAGDPAATAIRDDLQTIEREAGRAARIVANLRSLAGRSRSELSEPVPVNLNDVIRHVLATRSYSFETRSIEVDRTLAAGLPMVLADEGEMEQVILNLVINAEQALEAWGGPRRLAVRSCEREGAVVVEIADSGPGVSPADAERIFDPFWTTKAPGQGTGLGLSLVHSLLSESGGTIQVRDARGGGAQFIVALPALDPAAVVGRPGRSRNESGPVRPLKILVVEDEPAIRTLLVRFLNRRGHQTDSAPGGEEALRMIRAALELEAGYDVIVSDLRMPGLAGEELFRALEAQGEGTERRLVFMTGDAMGGYAESTLALMGAPVVYKPFELQEAASRIEEHGEVVGPWEP